MTTFALTGGCIISRQFSGCDDERFVRLIEILRRADVSFSHLEGTICAPETPEAYPAAEAGWTWIRNPQYFTDELKWAGFDLVSHASNHAVDYMYGGLFSTWQALDSAGLPHAGTGRTLREAREPAFLDVAAQRVALISASSSTADWARAADPRGKDAGRPGINQLRTVQRLGPAESKQVKQLARQMGWWITEVDEQFMINPAGLHNTVTRFVTSDEPGMSLVADEVDVVANLRAVEAARSEADFVIFHIHNHEWDPAAGLTTPPDFARSLAHACIDAGADIFIAEGSHATLRGIEIYNGKPIFYDTGDLFKDGNAKTRPLSEYYWVRGKNLESGQWEITSADSTQHSDIDRLPVASNPVGGYSTSKVRAVMAPICTFDEHRQLTHITVYPVAHLTDSPDVYGLPGLLTGTDARRVIDFLGELSAPYGTTIAFNDGHGEIHMPRGS